MVWIIDAKYVKDYQVWLRLNDSTEKVIDFKDKIFSEKRVVFMPLKDYRIFQEGLFEQGKRYHPMAQWC